MCNEAANPGILIKVAINLAVNGRRCLSFSSTTAAVNKVSSQLFCISFSLYLASEDISTELLLGWHFVNAKVNKFSAFSSDLLATEHSN